MAETAISIGMLNQAVLSFLYGTLIFSKKFAPVKWEGWNASIGIGITVGVGMGVEIMLLYLESECVEDLGGNYVYGRGYYLVVMVSSMT